MTVYGTKPAEDTHKFGQNVHSDYFYQLFGFFLYPSGHLCICYSAKMHNCENKYSCRFLTNLMLSKEQNRHVLGNCT